MYEQLIAGAKGMSFAQMIKIKGYDSLMALLPNGNYISFDVLCLNDDGTQRYESYADVASRWTTDDPPIASVIAPVSTWKARHG